MKRGNQALESNKKEYRSIMGGEPILPNLHDLSPEALHKHNIEIKDPKLVGNWSLYVDERQISQHATILVYKATLSRFIITLRAKKVEEVFQNDFGQDCPNGTSGRVVQKTIAVKKMLSKVQFLQQNGKNKEARVEQVVREVAFFKLCSLLKIGPAISTESPFDLFIYNNAIQFYIEKCKPILPIQENTEEQRLIKHIRECLRTLHGLQLIHGDVKPHKMVFSKKYKKYTLCDFDLSRCVSSPFGFLTKTTFFGTIGYVCNEMGCLHPNKRGYVNLYLNDAHGLLVTMEFIRKSIIQNTQRLRHISTEIPDNKQNEPSSNGRISQYLEPQPVVIITEVQDLIPNQRAMNNLAESLHKPILDIENAIKSLNQLQAHQIKRVRHIYCDDNARQRLDMLVERAQYPVQVRKNNQQIDRLLNMYGDLIEQQNPVVQMLKEMILRNFQQQASYSQMFAEQPQYWKRLAKSDTYLSRYVPEMVNQLCLVREDEEVKELDKIREETSNQTIKYVLQVVLDCRGAFSLASTTLQVDFLDDLYSCCTKQRTEDLQYLQGLRHIFQLMERILQGKQAKGLYVLDKQSRSRKLLILSMYQAFKIAYLYPQQFVHYLQQLRKEYDLRSTDQLILLNYYEFKIYRELDLKINMASSLIAILKTYNKLDHLKDQVRLASINFLRGYLQLSDPLLQIVEETYIWKDDIRQSILAQKGKKREEPAISFQRFVVSRLLELHKFEEALQVLEDQMVVSSQAECFFLLLSKAHIFRVFNNSNEAQLILQDMERQFQGSVSDAQWNDYWCLRVQNQYCQLDFEQAIRSAFKWLQFINKTGCSSYELSRCSRLLGQCYDAIMQKSKARQYLDASHYILQLISDSELRVLWLIAYAQHKSDESQCVSICKKAIKFVRQMDGRKDWKDMFYIVLGRHFRKYNSVKAVYYYSLGISRSKYPFGNAFYECFTQFYKVLNNECSKDCLRILVNMIRSRSDQPSEALSKSELFERGDYSGPIKMYLLYNQEEWLNYTGRLEFYLASVFFGRIIRNKRWASGRDAMRLKLLVKEVDCYKQAGDSRGALKIIHKNRQEIYKISLQMPQTQQLHALKNRFNQLASWAIETEQYKQKQTQKMRQIVKSRLSKR